MKTFICTDGNGGDLEIEAKSAEEAAKEYVDGGDWGNRDSTCWVRVHVVPLVEDGEPDYDQEEIHTVTLDPEEPPCCGDKCRAHEWESPHEVVGGLRDNPGVMGHGGGVIIEEVCANCGMYRVTNTWAQDPDTGVQGLTSVEYRGADEASIAWVASRPHYYVIGPDGKTSGPFFSVLAAQLDIPDDHDIPVHLDDIDEEGCIESIRQCQDVPEGFFLSHRETWVREKGTPGYIIFAADPPTT